MFRFFSLFFMNTVSQSSLSRLFSGNFLSTLLWVSFVLCSFFSTSFVSFASEECTENCVHPRGGSNPLVVEALRQETYKMRALAQAQPVVEYSFEKYSRSEETPLSSVSSPLVMPYPEDILTLGEVEAQKKAEEIREKVEIVSPIIDKNLQGVGFQTQFSDIEESVYKKEIIAFEGLNVVSGREEAFFQPSESINRAEAVKVATLVASIKVVEPEDQEPSPYADVPEGHWSVPYFRSALQNSFITLVPEISPSAPVSVQESLLLYESSTRVPADVLGAFFPEQKRSENITREEFIGLSFFVVQALRKEDEGYVAPSEQLNGDEYSASDRIPDERFRSTVLESLFYTPLK